MFDVLLHTNAVKPNSLEPGAVWIKIRNGSPTAYSLTISVPAKNLSVQSGQRHQTNGKCHHGSNCFAAVKPRPRQVLFQSVQTKQYSNEIICEYTNFTTSLAQDLIDAIISHIYRTALDAFIND